MRKYYKEALNINYDLDVTKKKQFVCILIDGIRVI